MRFAQHRVKKPGTEVAFKRRVGYFDEELSTTRAKLDKMLVDEEDDSEHRDGDSTDISATGGTVAEV